MKDSSENSSELEQKKFSFDFRSAEKSGKAVSKAGVTMAETIVDEPAPEIDAAIEVAIETPVAESGGVLPGSVLAAERRRRGFVISDIANQLFLTEKQIAALEDDDYDHFPAPIFVTGYIRNYARLLDLPPEPLIELFNSQSTQSIPELDRVSRATDHVVSKKGSSAPRMMAGVTVGLAVIALLWWGISSGPEEEMIVNEVASIEDSMVDDSMIATIPAITSTPVTTEIISPVKPAAEIEEVLPVKKVVDPVEVVKEASVIESSENVTKVALEPEFIADSAAVQSFPDSMVLTFSAESWVEITDVNDRRVMFDLGKPGQTRVLSGTAPFRILFGYSPAVTMTFNGEEFDQSSLARGKIARFTLGNNTE